MPEGDTLHRIALAMSPRLTGETVERVQLEQVDTSVSGVVSSVYARGKHLLIHVGDVYLRTHLGLHGSWHRYPKDGPGRWKRPRWQASLLVETSSDTYVCFNAKEADCIPSTRLSLHRPLRRLGPDLLAADVNFDEVVTRARRYASEKPVDGMLLDQRVASGVGNVYKSELLFLTGWSPKTPAADLTDDEIAELYQEARRRMQPNVHRAHRSTREGIPRLWVYGRSGQPCLRCEATIRFARMSRDRSTYWCPDCQRRYP